MLPCSRLVLGLPAMRQRKSKTPSIRCGSRGSLATALRRVGTTRLRRLLRTLLAQLREHVAGFFDGVDISGFVVGD